MADFPKYKIKIRYKSLDYGPFKFDLEDALPAGVTLSDITAKTYLGKVEPEDDLTLETETSSEIVDTVKTVVASSYVLDVFFNYPSTAAYKGVVNHTLLLEITMSNGGTHVYYHEYVTVY